MSLHILSKEFLVTICNDEFQFYRILVHFFIKRYRKLPYLCVSLNWHCC
jgi:hypothetical protein